MFSCVQKDDSLIYDADKCGFLSRQLTYLSLTLPLCLLFPEMLTYGQSPSKHEVFTQCYFNVGPASKTVGQH